MLSNVTNSWRASSEDIEWMSALPYTLSLPSMGCIVVHAGLVPGVSLDSQDAEAMCCMRNVVELEDGRGYEPLVLPTEGTAHTDPYACDFS